MLTIDEANGLVTVARPDGSTAVLAMNSPEAFSVVSNAWLRCGWDVKYVYGFTWMGRPIIQLPEDLVRIQEVIWRLAPDVIVETGVAHGGSLVFYAGIQAALGRGRVIGIDVEIRSHNRAAIEMHPMSTRIALIEGSSTAPETLAAVRARIMPGETVLVLLDSDHSYAHVARELELYAPLVSLGSYIVACDGIMAQVAGAPRTKPDWTWNNPIFAVKEFLERDPRFRQEEPGFVFNEGTVRERVTYWPKSFLRRVASAAS
jgi:cephalosporin hydroxylase